MNRVDEIEHDTGVDPVLAPVPLPKPKRLAKPKQEPKTSNLKQNVTRMFNTLKGERGPEPWLSVDNPLVWESSDIDDD
jgi:hypothetical protein